MLSALWESAKELYASNTVTNYLFPTVAGIWLALFTANLIYIRDIKSRIYLELFNVMVKFMDAEMRNKADAEKALLVPFKGLVLMTDDLRRRGYGLLDREVLDTMNSITKQVSALFIELFNQASQVFPLALREQWLKATDAERATIPLPQTLLNEFRQRGARLLAARIVLDAQRIQAVKSEWFALFEVRSVGLLVERCRRNYLAFCEHLETGEQIAVIKARDIERESQRNNRK